jgi:hypothetical protein
MRDRSVSSDIDAAIGMAQDGIAAIWAPSIAAPILFR